MGYIRWPFLLLLSPPPLPSSWYPHLLALLSLHILLRLHCAVLAGVLTLCSPLLDFRKGSAVLGFTLLGGARGRRQSSHPYGDVLWLQIIFPFSAEAGALYHHLILSPFFTLSFFQTFLWSFLLMLPLPREPQFSKHYHMKDSKLYLNWSRVTSLTFLGNSAIFCKKKKKKKIVIREKRWLVLLVSERKTNWERKKKPKKLGIINNEWNILTIHYMELLRIILREWNQDGWRSRMWSSPSPTNIPQTPTSTYRMILTEHLLKAGRRPQTSKKARQSPHNWVGQKEKKRGNRTGPALLGRSC